MKLDLFFERMKQYMEPEDLALFQAAYQQPPQKGVRINSLRTTIDWLRKHTQEVDTLIPTPFSPYHFYVREEMKGSHPYHLAGLYYMQEPSAGSAVEVLAPKPGDVVLDLCGAPGGKSTQIGAMLQGEGLLVSNEIVSSRAQVLLSNMERMGVTNAVITNMHPQALANSLPKVFDKVLVDAPCSGEGMFRKDPKALADWSLEHVLSCASRQLPILSSAYEALREGGVLVYSTCTFSVEENEEVIASFLAKYPDMCLVDPEVTFGREGIPTPGIDASLVRRIYPMDGGEGHFVCKMMKAASDERPKQRGIDVLNDVSVVLTSSKAKHQKTEMAIVLAFFQQQLVDYDPQRIYIHNNIVYYLPRCIPSISSLKLVRAGVCVGEISHNLLKPHHHFFMAFAPNQYRQCVSLTLDDPRVKLFLQGHEIMDDSTLSGYCCIQVDGFSIGFGKKSNQAIKNHYPKGLRIHP